jgi:hypothetical protein
MAFDIAATASAPVANISFNNMNIAATATAPVAAISFLPATNLSIAAVASAPVPDILFDEAWQIQASASAPLASITFNPVTLLSIAAKASAPVPNIQLGQAWVLNATASVPVASLSVVGNADPFIIAASASAPLASITFGPGQSTTFTVLVMNLANKVVSEYQNYNFNSACKFNGIYLGADKSTGVHILSGKDDNGTPIDASITLGDSNFGVTNLKFIPEMLVNYFGDGLEISILRDQKVEMDDTDAIINGPYDVPATFDSRVQTKRARFPKGYESGYWQFKAANVQGGDFNIESLEIPMDLSRRRRN